MNRRLHSKDFNKRIAHAIAHALQITGVNVSMYPKTVFCFTDGVYVNIVNYNVSREKLIRN